MKALIISVIAISAAFVFISGLDGVAHAQAQSPTYFLLGYDGNKTIYMSNGVYTSQSLGNISVPGNTFYCNNIKNPLKQTERVDGSLGMAVSHKMGGKYSFGEVFDSCFGNLRVAIPVAVWGFTRTTNITRQTMLNGGWPSIRGAMISAELRGGLVNSSTNLELEQCNRFDGGMNVTGSSSHDKNYLPVLLGSAALAFSALALVPPLTVVAFPIATAMGVLSVSDSVIQLGSTTASPNSGNTSSIDTPVSQEFFVNNGTVNYDTNGADCSFYSNYSTQEVLCLVIGSSEFSHSGSIQLTGNSMFYGSKMPSGCKGTNVSGASIDIPIVPAYTIQGQTFMNGVEAGNQTLILKDTSNGNNYYVRSNSSGFFRFFANPYNNYQLISPANYNGAINIDPNGSTGGDNLNVYLNDITFERSSGFDGNSWSVKITGPSGLSYTSPSTTAQTIQFGEIDDGGNFNYEITAPAGWKATPSEGTFNLSNTHSMSISFTPIANYTMTFHSEGSNDHLPWAISVNGYQEQTNGTSLSFNEPNGEFDWVVSNAVVHLKAGVETYI